MRRQFSRRAAQDAGADFLWREVENRMAERLDLIRLQPAALLDVGTGAGRGLRRLAARYPQASVIGLDPSVAGLRRARAERAGAGSALRRWLGRALGSRGSDPGPASAAGASPAPAAAAVGEALVAADAHALPLRDACVDLVWSNLAWHWFHDPPQVAREWYRVIRPGGLVMFSAWGVDTLRELRALGAVLPEWPDMHDLGDLLLEAGFAEPVMDTEVLTLTWDDPSRLLDELHAMAGNPSRARPRGLCTPRARARWQQALDGQRDPSGRIPITVEVVHGHAWCPPHKRLAPGYAPVTLHRRGGPAARA